KAHDPPCAYQASCPDDLFVRHQANRTNLASVRRSVFHQCTSHRSRPCRLVSIQGALGSIFIARDATATVPWAGPPQAPSVNVAPSLAAVPGNDGRKAPTAAATNRSTSASPWVGS